MVRSRTTSRSRRYELQFDPYTLWRDPNIPLEKNSDYPSDSDSDDDDDLSSCSSEASNSSSSSLPEDDTISLPREDIEQKIIDEEATKRARLLPEVKTEDPDVQPVLPPSPVSSSSDDDFGPLPPWANSHNNDSTTGTSGAGGDFDRVMALPSNRYTPEVERLAAFVKSGKRIPRRGEVGITVEEIERLEKVGYVMSGSRHRAMNAMREKKEQEAKTLEEKRERARIALIQRKENEAKRLEELRAMLSKHAERAKMAEIEMIREATVQKDKRKK